MGVKKPKAPPVQTVIPTIAPRMADPTVQDAGESARRRYGAAGQRDTLLTSGLGDASAPTGRKKTLLGQ